MLPLFYGKIVVEHTNGNFDCEDVQETDCAVIESLASSLASSIVEATPSTSQVSVTSGSHSFFMSDEALSTRKQFTQHIDG